MLLDERIFKIELKAFQLQAVSVSSLINKQFPLFLGWLLAPSRVAHMTP
jgi:hypothetical protein